MKIWTGLLIATFLALIIILLWSALAPKKSYADLKKEPFSQRKTTIDFSKDTQNPTLDNVDENVEPEYPPLVVVEEEPKDELSVVQKVFGKANNKKITFNIDKKRKGRRFYFYQINVPSYEDYSFDGKGLVIAANGLRYRYLTGLYMNLYVIRNLHGSDIPVEIFYVGKEEAFSPEFEKALMKLGNVKIIDLLDCLDTKIPPQKLKGYQTKPLACLCSSFEEIVLMDADALSFIDPFFFFKLEGYEQNGMILFKDYVNCTKYISKTFFGKYWNRR